MGPTGIRLLGVGVLYTSFLTVDYGHIRRSGMKQAKCSVRGGMKVRAYPLLCRAAEEGVAYGWRRAHDGSTAGPARLRAYDYVLTYAENREPVTWCEA
jgi:hypothetical protein